LGGRQACGLRLFLGWRFAGCRAGGKQRCRKQTREHRAPTKWKIEHVAVLAKPQAAWGIDGRRNIGGLQSCRLEVPASMLETGRPLKIILPEPPAPAVAGARVAVELHPS